MGLISSVLGGTNVLASALGAFGGSETKRTVDPFTQQAVDYYNLAKQQAGINYDRTMATGVSQYNQQANNVAQQALSSASNTGLQPDNAVVRALRMASKSGNIGGLMSGASQAGQQYESAIERSAQGIGEQASQVMYEQEPDWATRAGMFMRDATGGASSGVASGMNLNLGMKGMNYYQALLNSLNKKNQQPTNALGGGIYNQ